MTQNESSAFLMSLRPPSERQRWLARGVVATVVGIGLATAAFRDVRLARVDAFLPIVNTVIFLSGVTTAVLLFAQFALSGSRALLALANGYLVMALVIAPHMMVFPGVFAPDGLLGAPRQAAAWLFIAQHVAFLMGAIAYSLLRDRPPNANWIDRVLPALSRRASFWPRQVPRLWRRITGARRPSA